MVTFARIPDGMRLNWLKWAMVSAVLTGCSVNKDIMFKTPTDYQFDVMPDSLQSEFRLEVNDYLEMRLFANDGFRLIDLVSEAGADARAIQRQSFRYLVEFDGMANMPMLGRVPLAGLTLREAEFYLEGEFVKYYNAPFIQVAVVNRRVVVFPGGGGDAQVVNLDNNSTTLLEVIALAGGMHARANASRVKVFRKKRGGGRTIYRFDLSDIDGLKYADMVMQGDDVVYVEPTPELARELLYDLTPLITLLTTTILVIGVVNGFGR